MEYEAVEGRIRDTERELIRITMYYDARLAEDKAAVNMGLLSWCNCRGRLWSIRWSCFQPNLG